jgi:AraC-like DNA-binding protein
MMPALPSVLAPTLEIARHQHETAYATLVIAGSYEEAGDSGRFHVTGGDVLVHAAFSCHHDRISRAGTLVLDLPLPLDGRDWPARGRLSDPDLIIRVASRDRQEATGLLSEGFAPDAARNAELPDLLACDLSIDPGLALGPWAIRHGVARETAWRQFRVAYGVDAATYRSEARTRRAWGRIVQTTRPLAEVAADAGFSDQSHMTRAVKALTGRSPGAWRKAVQHRFKTSSDEGGIREACPPCTAPDHSFKSET